MADAHEASVWAAVDIRELRAGDGPEVRALWERCGIRIRPGDDDMSLGALAARNRGLCIVGCEGERIVATALAGFDGRRGWLYHVATDPEMRRRGIGTRMVHAIEQGLRAMGCKKLNLIVWKGEEDAVRFWEAIGYALEPTVEYSKRLLE
jgi:GNAT superfamily N-acetyltransferase